MSRPRSIPGAAFTAICIALVAPSASPAAPSRDLDAVLEQARSAAGSDWRLGHAGIQMTGTTNFAGLDGPVTFALMADGRFVRRIETALPDGFGFDGTLVWASDWTGMPRALDHGERDWAEITMAVVGGTWMRDGSPVTVTLGSPYPGAVPAADTIALTLRHAKSGFECELKLDARTHLPATLSRPAILGRDVFRFESYREFLGARFATVITQPTLGPPTVHRIARVEPIADGDVVFGPPPEPGDARFLDGVPAALEVKRARTGHFLVKPLVNGRDVGWFIFDTGAGSMTLAPAVAEELGLPEIGRTGIMSIMGTQQAAVRRGHALRLGPLVVEHPLFVDLDMGFVEEHMGEKIAGVVGFDVIRRTVVEIDVKADRVALYDPKAFDGSEAAVTGWQQIYLSERHPVIEAAFEGHSGLFKMDVGAAGGPFANVTLHAPAVRRLALLDGRKTQKMDLGTAQVAVGELDWFELGGKRFEKPEAMFALGGSGPFQDPTTMGNIGVNFLAPFRIVFDYGRRRVALVKREGS